jgi:ERCC4-type nuclease
LERLCQRACVDERRHNSSCIWFVVVDHRERRETVTAKCSNRYV